MLWKRVLKQAVGKVEGRSEIAAIPNKYKNTLDNLIDSSNTKFLNQSESLDRLGPIDKGTHNVPRYRGTSPSLLEEDCLDKNVLVTFLELAPKTQDFQVYKCHDVASLGPKSGRAQYEKGQRGKEDGKGKRDRENRRNERGGGGHCGNKVNLVVGENSGSKASVYHHIWH